MALNYLLLFVPLIFNTTLKIGFGALCLFAVQLTLQTFEIENFYLFCYPVILKEYQKKSHKSI